MAVVKYTKPSLQDVKEIREYIALDSPLNARRFIEGIKERVTILNKYPEIGHLVFPNRFKNLRQLLHKSYRIVYNYDDDIVTILTIHHQSRLVENVGIIKKYKEE